jgi:Asp-tRNA(Asn)/Glu-tRNA(Gln) amidotransferase C subunit
MEDHMEQMEEHLGQMEEHMGQMEEHMGQMEEVPTTGNMGDNNNECQVNFEEPKDKFIQI